MEISVQRVNSEFWEVFADGEHNANIRIADGVYELEFTIPIESLDGDSIIYESNFNELLKTFFQYLWNLDGDKYQVFSNSIPIEITESRYEVVAVVRGRFPKCRMEFWINPM